MPGGADSAAAAPDAAYEPPQVSRGRCGPSHAPLYTMYFISDYPYKTNRGACQWLHRPWLLQVDATYAPPRVEPDTL